MYSLLYTLVLIDSMHGAPCNIICKRGGGGGGGGVRVRRDVVLTQCMGYGDVSVKYIGIKRSMCRWT